MRENDLFALRELPRISIEHRKTLPSIPAVYFVLWDGVVMYVGKATSLRGRWLRHHRQDEVGKLVGAEIAWMSVDTRSLDAAERLAIVALHPILNGSRSPSLRRRTGSPRLKEIVNQAIVCAMTEGHISNADLARRMKCSPVTSLLMVQTARNLQLDTLERLASALGLQVTIARNGKK